MAPHNYLCCVPFHIKSYGLYLPCVTVHPAVLETVPLEHVTVYEPAPRPENLTFLLPDQAHVAVFLLVLPETSVPVSPVMMMSRLGSVSLPSMLQVASQVPASVLSTVTVTTGSVHITLIKFIAGQCICYLYL